jgi:polyribonucleotide nucleotidyltransferase
MDAGVPIIAPVAGISVGLMTENTDGAITKWTTITDIIGEEDHFGDMDFKVAGTTKGITGFQLDLKLRGLPHDLMTQTLEKARIARQRVLALPQLEDAANNPDHLVFHAQTRSPYW